MPRCQTGSPEWAHWVAEILEWSFDGRVEVETYCYVPRKSQLVIPRFAGSKFARCPTQRYYMGQDPMPKSDGLNVQQNKRRQD